MKWLSVARAFVAVAILALGCTPARPPAGDTSAAEAPDAEVSAFIEKYFATWSAHDLEAYGRCFDVDAKIQFLRQDGRLKVYGLRDLLENQRKVQAADPDSRETATFMRIERKGDVATAFVRWRLESGGRRSDQQRSALTEERIVTGTDCFLLARRKGEWLVTALLVKSDP